MSQLINYATTYPVHWAAFQGDTARIRQLISDGRDVNELDCVGKTALIDASAYGEVGAGQLLIELGANLDVIPHDGETALHKSASMGYDDFVALLLDNGAKLILEDNDGNTALQLALTMERWYRLDRAIELLINETIRRYGQLP